MSDFLAIPDLSLFQATELLPVQTPVGMQEISNFSLLLQQHVVLHPAGDMAEDLPSVSDGESHDQALPLNFMALLEGGKPEGEAAINDHEEESPFLPGLEIRPEIQEKVSSPGLLELARLFNSSHASRVLSQQGDALPEDTMPADLVAETVEQSPLPSRPGLQVASPLGSESSAEMIMPGSILSKWLRDTTDRPVENAEAGFSADELLDQFAMKSVKLAPADRDIQLNEKSPMTSDINRFMQGVQNTLQGLQTPVSSQVQPELSAISVEGKVLDIAEAGPAQTLNGLHKQVAASTSQESVQKTVSQFSLDMHPANKEWSEHLGKRLMMMAADNIQKAEIHLNPKHLGPLTVQLQIDDEGTRVHLLASHVQVKDALEAAVPRLREMLSQGQDEVHEQVTVNIEHRDASRGQQREYAEPKSGGMMDEATEMVEIADLQDSGERIAVQMADGLLSAYA